MPVEEAPKLRRTARKKAEPSAEDAPVSDEVAQARALAQISQASVVRRQRRAAERAAEMIAEGTADEEPAPKRRGRKPKSTAEAVAEDAAAGTDVPEETPAPKRRGRKPKAAAEPEGDVAAPATGAATETLATEAAPKKRRTRKAKADSDAAKGEETPADQPAIEDAPEEAPKKRRGRKPKAAADEAEVQAPSTESAADGAESASEVKDVRPGRGRRAKAEQQAADDAKPAETAADKADKAEKADDNAEPKQDGSEAQFEEGGKNRRHQNRRERNNDRDKGDRKNRKNRKDRNNRYNVPTEPSISRDDLTAMKVAELREKAKELDIDPAGKKKAELVEEIYTTNARIEGFRDIEGILEIMNDGFGYIRANGYMPSKDDAFVAANMIRAARLRTGDVIAGTLRPSRANDKFPGLSKIKTVNGMDPEEIRRRPKFSELTPIYPNEPLKMEHGKDSITGRAIDIVSPIGKGQRGLIVSPPKAGKTTILKKICQSISANNPEVHLICLLVDERPEEVTDMQRSIKGDVVASTFDMPADNHTRVSELVIERAKRIVELGGDVVVVLDSITRLARAYNLAAPASGRILSGGVDSAALYPPKRFLGAARNIENGGSLTILASALIDTGSKMDEVIFEEFKGTGNMELKLDRDLADRRIFPAIDPVASGTRNEDLLIDESMRPFVWGIRRILANMNNTERAAASFIKGLKGTNSNQEFLIRTAKKAADHEASR